MITMTGVGTVSFRNPDIANKYNLDANILVRYTRGQKVIVYKDTNWRNIETEIFAFQHIRESKRDEILDFFNYNLGLEISITRPRRDDCTIVDHVFTGYIYSDVIEYKTKGSNGCEQVYDFGLIVLYKIGQFDLKYLTTEDGIQLITEAGVKLKIEAD